MTGIKIQSSDQDTFHTESSNQDVRKNDDQVLFYANFKQWSLREITKHLREVIKNQGLQEGEIKQSRDYFHNQTS